MLMNYHMDCTSLHLRAFLGRIQKRRKMIFLGKDSTRCIRESRWMWACWGQSWSSNGRRANSAWRCRQICSRSTQWHSAPMSMKRVTPYHLNDSNVHLNQIIQMKVKLTLIHLFLIYTVLFEPAIRSGLSKIYSLTSTMILVKESCLLMMKAKVRISWS